MVAMLAYSVISLLVLRRKLRGAVLAEAGVYEAKNLKTPFVIGVLRPKIYIPAGLSTEERRYVLLHERVHIRRRDPLVKLFAFLVLCLHWFNPLAWVAFLLMGADMEMSCDERVMRELGGGIRRDYSLSLLRVAVGGQIWNASPLAFGEGGLKERIKNVLKFKKHARWVIALAVVALVALTLGFACDRLEPKREMPTEPPNIQVQWGDMNLAVYRALNQWNGSIYDRMDTFQVILRETAVSDLPYIPNGDVIRIIFDGILPDSAELAEYILRENGDMKYNLSGEIYALPGFDRNGATSFRILANWATALSSNSGDYAPGAIIKGYRLICRWGENECEYAFIIRGDAAVLMEQMPNLIKATDTYKVTWHADGSQFAWDHSDDPMLKAYSSAQYIPTVHFDDKAALDAYVAAGDALFGFASIFEKYDAAFFEDNRLAMVYLAESSSSIEHYIVDYTIEGDRLLINILRQIPEGGMDTDMSAKCILFEFSKADTAFINSFAAYYCGSDVVYPQDPIRAVNWQRVYPNGDGMEFAWAHSDDPSMQHFADKPQLPVVHFNDRAALDAYIAAGDALFGFAPLFEQYDDAFFADKRLVVIYARENSGSVRHEVSLSGIGNDGMEICVRRNRPQIGTADMLDCFIILECAADGEFAALQRFSAHYDL
ncbi:MAG: M56 family metallopeptidase [Clostridiales bacterium]|nr:M56 family metallopeptidase [Clostridiales bacterium]